MTELRLQSVVNTSCSCQFTQPNFISTALPGLTRTFPDAKRRRLFFMEALAEDLQTPNTSLLGIAANSGIMIFRPQPDQHSTAQLDAPESILGAGASRLYLLGSVE